MSKQRIAFVFDSTALVAQYAKAHKGYDVLKGFNLCSVLAAEIDNGVLCYDSAMAKLATYLN